ncbi:uncharacterized protein LOC112059026 isoform X7 [Chrysemys picta bellii]|nr:uncharacterized protein LOC112059026 isoform X3 [Chrysemys picta bellii]
MSHAALTIIGEWNLFVGARSEIITGYRKENKLIHTHETPGSQPGKGENKDKKSLSCMEDWSLLSYILQRSAHYDKLYS